MDGAESEEPPVGVSSTANPLLFVAQVPIATGASDIGTVTGTFGTHKPGIDSAPRGGSLYILYPDGTLRDLLADALAAACSAGRPECEPDGVREIDATTGFLTHGHAVREPSLHFDGNRVLFSMIRGVKRERYGQIVPDPDPVWQIYEIQGLQQHDTPVLRNVPSQPAGYNNVSPIYGSDNQIFFTSDMPITGQEIHYPQLEEYESEPTVSGLWRLDPATSDLYLMDHAPSGDFTPILGSDGVIYFTRWDHLQQDQQALNAVRKLIGSGVDDWDAYTYEDEDDVGPARYTRVQDLAAGALARGDRDTAYQAGEMGIPEYHNVHPVWTIDPNRTGRRAGRFNGAEILQYTPTNKYGRISDIRFNLFFPWQIRQDGTGSETLRHVGRHELYGFIKSVMPDDSNLAELQAGAIVRDGLFNMTQHPNNPAVFLGAVAPEFHTHAAGTLLEIEDREAGRGMHENGDALVFRRLTDPEGDILYRNPLMLSDGRLIASVDEIPESEKTGARDFYQFRFRLYTLKLDSNTGYYVPDEPLLPAVMQQRITYWDGVGTARTFDGALWEVTPIEVRPRPVPPMTLAPALNTPEAQVFASAGVDVTEFQDFLRENDLALLVMRNITARDEKDRQQPYNLRVDPDHVPAGKTGARTVDSRSDTTKIYDVAYMQYFENKLVRGYGKYARMMGSLFRDNGRRGLARPMDHEAALAGNIPTAAGAPKGAVRIAWDGSVAALVPANRSLTWAMTDDEGVPVVRERYWVKFAPGEIRVCAACHGLNDRGQDGQPLPTNQPEALRALLEYWKTTH